MKRNKERIKQVKTLDLVMQTSMLYGNQLLFFSNTVLEGTNFQTLRVRINQIIMGIMTRWISYYLENASQSHLLCKCLRKWESKLFSPRSITVNSENFEVNSTKQGGGKQGTEMPGKENAFKGGWFSQPLSCCHPRPLHFRISAALVCPHSLGSKDSWCHYCVPSIIVADRLS